MLLILKINYNTGYSTQLGSRNHISFIGKQKL